MRTLYVHLLALLSSLVQKLDLRHSKLSPSCQRMSSTSMPPILQQQRVRCNSLHVSQSRCPLVSPFPHTPFQSMMHSSCSAVTHLALLLFPLLLQLPVVLRATYPPPLEHQMTKMDTTLCSTHLVFGPSASLSVLFVLLRHIP